MRSMFWKLFLSFWLTILLGGAMSFLAISTFGHLSIDLLHDDMARKRDENLTKLITLYGQAAFQVFSCGGQAEYAAFSKGLSENTGIEVILVTPGNRTIAGEPLQAELVSIVERAKSEHQPLLEKTAGGVTVAEKLAIEDPTGPVVVGLIAFGPPPGIRPPGGKQPPFLARMLPPFFGPGEIIRTAVMLLLVSGVCYLLARSLATPIRKLQKTTQQIAGGDYSARIGDSLGRPGNEIADLGRDFDIMVERTESVITSQKRLLRDISHELRSPLARLNVALELAKKHLDGENDSSLAKIGRESNHLNELIEHLLILSRLESNNTGSLAMEPVDLTGMLREVATDADFEAAWYGRGVTVVAAAEVTVIGSGELLRRALENCIRNAAGYTAPGTQVEIVLTVQDDKVLISISDYGPGVPEADLPHIFEPFYRVAQARERETGGTGIGLAIAMQAVKIHGGNLAVKNGVPPYGLEVTLILPSPKSYLCSSA